LGSLACAASLLFRGSSHSDASPIGVLIFLFLLLLFIAIGAAGSSKTRRRKATAGGSLGRSGGTNPQSIPSMRPLREVPRESGPPQGAAADVSLVASHLKSAYPKTTFEVYSQHADVIHVAWKGAPKRDEVRSYLQTLRLQRQIPNVDFNFHHIDSGEPSPSSASGGKGLGGESLSHLEQSARGALGGDTGTGNKGWESPAGGGGGKMTELDWEIINRLDDILAKYRRKIAELREKAGIVDAKEEAIQILGQLGYKATEAKKLVDCCPAGLSANEIIQEVFKRTR